MRKGVMLSGSGLAGVEPVLNRFVIEMIFLDFVDTSVIRSFASALCLV